MGYNFRPVERDQQYLLPPSLRDWLPPDDLAWFVLDAVAQMDLDPIRSRYRADGWGAPAFDPELMVALLLYAYATGERSSRRIEGACRRDIAYRVICANQVPDHATIARFRAEHEDALAHLFTAVLRLCAAAGLVRLGVVALDGTKIRADAALAANRDPDALEAEMRALLAQAAATDAAEDEALGEGRTGEELPAELADPRSRLARLAEARRQLEADEAARQATYRERVASRDRLPRAERVKTRPPTRPAPRTARGNPTDPDSRAMRDGKWFVQGYNAQVVVAESGVVVSADITQQPTDPGQLVPMLAALSDDLERAAIETEVGVLLADGGYWSEEEVAELPETTPDLLIAPRVGRPRRHPTRWELPFRDAMARRFETPEAQALYRRRAAIVEPVFGQIKEGRGIRRFRRRGMGPCRSEWRLVCATHNLLKLWRHRLRSADRPPGPGGGSTRNRTQNLVRGRLRGRARLLARR